MNSPMDKDRHHQAQQYALKALKCYGTAASAHLHDLDDLAENPGAKDYIRKAAHSAATAIRKAVRLAEDSALHRCSRCGKLAFFGYQIPPASASNSESATH